MKRKMFRKKNKPVQKGTLLGNEFDKLFAEEWKRKFQKKLQEQYEKDWNKEKGK